MSSVPTMASVAQQFIDEPVIACGNFRRLGGIGNLLHALPFSSKRKRSGPVPDYFYIAVTANWIVVIEMSRSAPHPWMMSRVVQRLPRANVKLSQGSDTYRYTDYSGLINREVKTTEKTLILETTSARVDQSVRIECQSYRQTKGVLRELIRSAATTAAESDAASTFRYSIRPKEGSARLGISRDRRADVLTPYSPEGSGMTELPGSAEFTCGYPPDVADRPVQIAFQFADPGWDVTVRGEITEGEADDFADRSARQLQTATGVKTAWTRG